MTDPGLTAYIDEALKLQEEFEARHADAWKRGIPTPEQLRARRKC